MIANIFQDPPAISAATKSIEIIAWTGGAGFALWIFRQAYDIIQKGRENHNGKKEAELTKKAVETALHFQQQGELAECAKEIAKTQVGQNATLDKLAQNFERQTEILDKLTTRRR